MEEINTHNKIDDEVISTHILSFNLTVSHHREEHAPNRMYLPSDVNFTTMFTDFVAKNSNFKCSYEKYRRVAKELNISIVKLGHEECELCEELRLHDPNHTKQNLIPDCDICSKWKVHIDKATKAREKYREDAEKTEDIGKVIYCADLEKVIMRALYQLIKSNLTPMYLRPSGMKLYLGETKRS